MNKLLLYFCVHRVLESHDFNKTTLIMIITITPPLRNRNIKTIEVGFMFLFALRIKLRE